MNLAIDSASSARRLQESEFRAWASTHSAFISSEMSQLASERQAVASVLREAGMTVILFEDLGGRDEDAATAYLDGVAQCDVYIGIVADRYGQMRPSGRSPTHDEFLAARERGKRISVWLASDGSGRQGNARDFVQEIQTFHTTGRFSDSDDLARRVLERMGELAADDEAPWVKMGENIFRAGLVRDLGERIEVEAEVRDQAVARGLEALRPDQWSAAPVSITTAHRSGRGAITEVVSESRSASSRKITIHATVEWGTESGDSMAVGTSRFSSDDLVEVGLNAGLLGRPLPDELSSMTFLVDDSDPLEDLPDGLPEAIYQVAARLLLVERLAANRQVGHVDDFLIGPSHQGQRAISLTYTEPRRYSNVDPGERTVSGLRSV